LSVRIYVIEVVTAGHVLGASARHSAKSLIGDHLGAVPPLTGIAREQLGKFLLLAIQAYGCVQRQRAKKRERESAKRSGESPSLSAYG
jgi:hypothetical protein